MAVLTTDIQIEGIRRDEVFNWLGDFTKHETFLRAGFPELRIQENQEIVLPFYAGWKNRELGYIFIGPDASHGGRRVKCTTTGKRTSGHLNYSLRTMKPSRDTLITLHMDYAPGSILGALISDDIQRILEECFSKVLQELKTHIERDLNP